MLNSVVLALVARNVQSLVDFVNRLDTRLDAFLAKHDAQVVALETKLDKIYDDGANRLEAIWASAAEQTDALTDRVEGAAKAAEIQIANIKQSRDIAATLKKALPTPANTTPAADA